MRAEDWQQGGFGLYIHWPFCLAKCPYCDFNSHVSDAIDQHRWRRAYVTEIARAGAETAGRTLGSVYFGGGTPSLMDPDLVGAILDAVRATWPLSNDLEVTLEANPTSVEAARFRGYAKAGVSRISLGIQSLIDEDLRRLGRLHSARDALEALAMARDSFARVSFDLIYARQDQHPGEWRAELAEALALGPDHLSLYQLTIEEGTAFGDRFAPGRLPGLPDEDAGAEMYEITQALCAAAGLPAYEISNHAADMARSRHNLVYWRGGDYLGIGPGAHGRLTLGGTRTATETVAAPLSWLRQVEETGSGELPRTVITPAEQAAEYAMMGLRLSEGISLPRLDALHDSTLNKGKMHELVDRGLLRVDGPQLSATSAGRPLLNAVLRELLAG